MDYVTDTHSLVRYFIGLLPQRAWTIFQRTETGQDLIYIPTIVLAECYYLMKRGKIALDWDELIAKIDESSNFITTPFDLTIVKMLPRIPLSELHDQIIVATAQRKECPVITKDPEMKEYPGIETIWS